MQKANLRLQKELHAVKEVTKQLRVKNTEMDQDLAKRGYVMSKVIRKAEEKAKKDGATIRRLKQKISTLKAGLLLSQTQEESTTTTNDGTPLKSADKPKTTINAQSTPSHTDTVKETPEKEPPRSAQTTKERRLHIMDDSGTDHEDSQKSAPPQYQSNKLP